MLKKIGLIALIALSLMAFASCSKNKTNNTKKDLKEHYGYSAIAGKDTYIVVSDGNAIGMGFVEDGEVYVPYAEYRKNVDNKCYIDKNEKMLVYTTATNMYDSYVGSSEYTDFDGNKNSYFCAIALEVDGRFFVSAKFLKEFGAKIDYKMVKEPDRVVITATFTNNVVTASTDTNIRVEASDRTDILAPVKKGDKLVLVAESGDYRQVRDANGVMGYVNKSVIGEPKEENIKREKEPEAYTHFTSDEKICLGWHQMAYDTGNDNFSELVKDAEPLNVISPTWYQLNDKNGGIESLSDGNYVKKAHEKGMKVWALVNDFGYDDNREYYVTDVLSHSTSRRNLIKNLVTDVKDKGIDGINVDFECIGIEIADDYVEFICELSVWCRKEGIVLSVDMYVPSDINKYYNRETVLEVADYLIIMGYDEHWAGADSAGSVASLPYVEKGIQNTISEGDSKRVINAIPFYTRIWSETPLEFAEDGSQIVDDHIKGSYALDSKAVGLGTAEKEIEAHGVNKFWVEDLSQYYAEYEEDNSLMRVWLEEEKSIKAKLDVMSGYNLGGVACWRMGLEESWVWDIISGYVNE